VGAYAPTFEDNGQSSHKKRGEEYVIETQGTTRHRTGSNLRETGGVGQTSVSNSARHEEIRIRAYEIYIERDGQPGDELSDWVQAEREVESNVRHEERGN
jgi:Protein of unknown function (DUF2934)